jgi:quercetin dioxygenase-like cupin family protein
MKGILTAISALIVTGAAAIVAAQQPTMSNTEVLRADLSAPGREVIQTYAVLPPGAGSSSKHTHPGEEVVFVIEGPHESSGPFIEKPIQLSFAQT